MNNTFVTWFFIAVVVALLAILMARKSSELADRLSRIVTSFGWEAPQRIWWSGALRGRWRGLAVELRPLARQKGVPQRLLLTIRTASPARIIVKRRGGFLSKPLLLFGPPFVDPANATLREQFWVRSDEPALVERLFAAAGLAAELDRNLISRFDVINLGLKRLRILRAVDDRAVKKHFNRPFLRFGWDYEVIETIASEEWRLAEMIVDTLGLRGYERA